MNIARKSDIKNQMIPYPWNRLQLSSASESGPSWFSVSLARFVIGRALVEWNWACPVGVQNLQTD